MDTREVRLREDDEEVENERNVRARVEDFSASSFDKKNYYGQHLNVPELENKLFFDCIFYNTVFGKMRLNNVAFINCNMANCDLSEASLSNVIFQGVETDYIIISDQTELSEDVADFFLKQSSVDLKFLQKYFPDVPLDELNRMRIPLKDRLSANTMIYVFNMDNLPGRVKGYLFDDSDFESINASNKIFENCVFFGCKKFKKANFSRSMFFNTVFLDCDVNGINPSNSYMTQKLFTYFVKETSVPIKYLENIRIISIDDNNLTPSLVNKIIKEPYEYADEENKDIYVLKLRNGYEFDENIDVTLVETLRDKHRQNEMKELQNISTRMEPHKKWIHSLLNQFYKKKSEKERIRDCLQAQFRIYAKEQLHEASMQFNDMELQTLQDEIDNVAETIKSTKGGGKQNKTRKRKRKTTKKRVTRRKR